MHGFSSYDSCSTNSCTHTDTIRVCCMHTYICVFHFHNGILFRNEIAAKCNSIGVCSRRRQIITEYEKINESISVFDALNTHKHTGALTHAQWCCYYCRILNFHGKTWKLVAYLFFFFERSRRRCHNRRRNNRRQIYNWTNNTPSGAAHADAAAWGVAAAALLELEFEHWKIMRTHKANLLTPLILLFAFYQHILI